MTLALGAADAQNLKDSPQPAEFPPASYTGKQYVDSKGCVFVRAGFDGAVTWVPRVSRARKVICGFAPTQIAGRNELEVIPDTDPAPVETPRVVATPTPTPEAPAPRVVATTKPAPVIRSTTPVQTATRTVVKPVPPKPETPQPSARVMAAAESVCANASSVGQRYLLRGTGLTVRCGPQGVHPGSFGYQASVTSAPSTPGTYSPAPTVRIEPPAGYKSAFEDDRLNPNRGHVTREGFEQMRLVWTAGVPRQLVDQNTGKNVTHLFPGLRFPFISQKQQNEYVALNGWPASSGEARTNTNVVVAMKNTPPNQPVASGHRFVQVGTFGVPSNAQNTVARLQQMGLPVRVGTFKKRGKTYKIVLAGPFGDAGALQNGLSAVRGAGFRDAFTRK